MPNLEDPEDWQGFDPPRYTPVPDAVFDIWMSRLSGAEFKVLCYICRRTFGFKKDADDISIGQMARGIITRDGRQLDDGTGLSESSVKDALRELIRRRLVTAQRNQSATRGHEPTTYRLLLRGELPLAENRLREGVKIGQGDSQNPVPPLSQISAIQETVVQETANKIQRDESNHFSQFVMAVADDFSRELGDAEHASANMSQANRLWRDSGLDEPAFVTLMQEARRRTRLAQGGQGSGSVQNKAAYFFQTLRALLMEGRANE